jgi:DNA replication protein DnaC
MEWVYVRHAGDRYTTERCSVCGPHRQAEYLRRIDGLTAEMRTWTFANTVTARNPDAWQTAQAVAQSPEWFLTLSGPYGIGKTRMLTCIVNEARESRWPAVYLTTAQLLDHLRNAYAPNAEVSFDGMWERVSKARVLALDELDRWNPTPWAQEKFFQLIDARYRAGAEMLTVFATNSDIDNLPGYVQSRMMDRRCRIFKLAGTDMRQVRR